MSMHFGQCNLAFCILLKYCTQRNESGWVLSGINASVGSFEKGGKLGLLYATSVQTYVEPF